MQCMHAMFEIEERVEIESRVEHLGSGAGIVNAGGDEEAAFSVEDESPVIVTHVERFEPLRCYFSSLNAIFN